MPISSATSSCIGMCHEAALGAAVKCPSGGSAFTAALRCCTPPPPRKGRRLWARHSSPLCLCWHLSCTSHPVHHHTLPGTGVWGPGYCARHCKAQAKVLHEQPSQLIPVGAGAYVMKTAFQTSTISSAMFITAMAANPLAVDLAR